MGFFGLFRKKKEVNSHSVESGPKKPTETLETLEIREGGEIDELLSKLYLLSSKVVDLEDKHIRGAIIIHGIVDHEDVLDQMFDRAKDLRGLFNVIQQDSFLVIKTAKEIKKRLMATHHIKDERELLQYQASAFARVLMLEPQLNQINDGISFCIFTIEEIRGKVKQKDKIAYEASIHDELSSISINLEKLSTTITEVIKALSALSTVNHETQQMGLKKEVSYDIKLEKDDIEQLLHIFATAHKQLTVATKQLWASEDGKEQLRLVLQDHILPSLQKALRYDDAIESAVKDTEEKILGLAQEKNFEIKQQQIKLEDLATSIRTIFVKLNTNTIPGLLEMTERYEPDKKMINDILCQILKVFASLYQKIKDMEKLFLSTQNVVTKDEKFVMGMND